MSETLAPSRKAEGLEEKASDVARVMKALSNERRLLILCELAASREASVNALATTVGLSQSALSQHLAVMREEGLISFRRDAQTLYYRIADRRIGLLLDLLHDLYCSPSA